MRLSRIAELAARRIRCTFGQRGFRFDPSRTSTHARPIPAQSPAVVLDRSTRALSESLCSRTSAELMVARAREPNANERKK